MLPVCIAPHNDELFNSFIFRLAKANEITMQSLVGRGLHEESNCRKVSKFLWNNDGKGLFSPFFKTFPANKENYIQNHSIYPFLMPFLTAYRQAVVANMLFNDIPVKRCIQLIRFFLYCPECKKEETETYGHYYLHRSHHLPGVTVCHKHHVPLVRFDTHTPVTPTEDAIAYAMFSADILFKNLQTTIDEIQRATTERNHNIPQKLRKQFFSANYNKIPDVIRCLMQTFGSVEALASCLKPCETYTFTMPPKKKKPLPFAQQVRELTGDEYVVVGEYKGQNQYVEIRHETCGHTQRYIAKHFLRGARCSRCSKIISVNSFPEIVEHMTCGQYKVIRSIGYDFYEIAEEGGTVLELSAALFLQEILRPTPSDILPVPVKQLRNDWNVWNATRPNRISTKDLYERICSLYKSNDFIFMEDLRRFFSDDFYKTLKKGIQKLIREGKLFSVEKGIYTLSPKEFTPEELLTQKYILRNGKRIGIYDSKSLAYEMGMAEERSNTLFIMTNKESMTHGRTRTINGLPVHLRGNKILITEENYKYIMVLEAIKYSFHYDNSYNYRIPQFIQKHDLHLNGFISLLPFYSENVTKLLKNMWRDYEQNNRIYQNQTKAWDR